MTSKPVSRIDLAALEGEVLELVTQRLLDVPAGFGVSSPLAECGLDSMAVMQLLLLIEERFGLWVPEADLLPENLESVRSLARLLAHRLEERAGV